jgi:hypothetical protein
MLKIPDQPKIRKSCRKRIITALIVMGIVFLGFILLTARVYIDRAFICRNTLSRHGYLQWCFGIQTKQWYYKSPLETFMQQKHPDILEHQWISYSGTGKTILGTVRSRGHGYPGSILNLMQFDHEFQVYFDPLSDVEKKALYDVLSSGDSAKIDTVVDEIMNEILKQESAVRILLND